MQKAISILSRIREPSTWAGVAVLLSIFGVPMLHVEILGQAVNAVAALAAAAAVLMPEKTPAPTTTEAPPATGGG